MWRKWKMDMLESLLIPGPWILTLSLFEFWTANLVFLGYMIGLFVATVGRRYDIVFFRRVLTMAEKKKTARIRGLE